MAESDRRARPGNDSPGNDPHLLEAAQFILDRELTRREAAALERYIGLLQRWQRAYRLVGSLDRLWIVDNIVLDSLLFVRFLSFPSGRSARVLDLGSGAGVPGIPLAITSVGLSFCLLEPRRRRASFLATAVRELKLTNVKVLGLRSDEALRQEPALSKAFDAVVSRCAGPAYHVSTLAQPFLKPGGRLVVSGPPSAEAPWDRRTEPPVGGWQEVAHPRAGRTRRFWVSAATA
jgi:16S rRNA (guanine(527)-N(7))-methyltransferase RsmG